MEQKCRQSQEPLSHLPIHCHKDVSQEACQRLDVSVISQTMEELDTYAEMHMISFFQATYCRLKINNVCSREEKNTIYLFLIQLLKCWGYVATGEKGCFEDPKHTSCEQTL